MKNIWIINHYATPPQYGGLTRHHFLAKYIDKNEYNVTIIAASAIHNSKINMIEDNEKIKYKISNIDGVNYVHIKTNQYTTKIERIKNIFQFFFNTLYCKKKLVKEIGKPDVIYASSPQPFSVLLGILLKKKFKIECISEIRDIWPESIVSFKVMKNTSLIVKILYILEKYMYINSDKLVFTMEGGKDYISTKKYKNKIDMNKIYNLNNGVDLEVYKSNCKKYKIKDEDLNNKENFNVLYTGSIRHAYNIEQILNVAKYISDKGFKNIKFLLYGEGPFKEKLINYCKQNNINNVIFKGFVDNRYIPYIMTKCNTFLLHGTNIDAFKYGTSQNKLFSYLAGAKPIISTFNNKYDLIKRFNCGITVNGEDVQDYAESILKIYNMDNKEYEKYCNNAEKLSKEFDYQVLAKKLRYMIEGEEYEKNYNNNWSETTVCKSCNDI